jgi:hypothetical protein
MPRCFLKHLIKSRIAGVPNTYGWLCTWVLLCAVASGRLAYPGVVLWVLAASSAAVSMH